MIYLWDLYQKIQEQSGQFLPDFQASKLSEISPSLQQQFQLIVKQKQLGLPVEFLLAKLGCSREKEQRKTQKFLRKLLSDRSVNSSNHSLEANSLPPHLLNLDEIPEFFL